MVKSAKASPAAPDTGSALQSMAKHAKSGVAKPASNSKSAKAGLVFPVARVNRKILERKNGRTKRVGQGAPIYIAAAAEYIAAEILELAVNHCMADKRARLTVEDILHAVRNDKQLNRATGGLVVVWQDKMKAPGEWIMCKADRDTKQETKMRNTDWFTFNEEHVVALNWKRYLVELKKREGGGEEEEEEEEGVAISCVRCTVEWKWKW